MVTLEQIKLLESRIARAIDFVNHVTEENARLKKRNDELEETISSLKEEKNKVEEGIVSALGRLNQFEDAIERGLSAVKQVRPEASGQNAGPSPVQTAQQAVPPQTQQAAPPQAPQTQQAVPPQTQQAAPPGAAPLQTQQAVPQVPQNQTAAPQAEQFHETRSLPSAYTVDEDEELLDGGAMPADEAYEDNEGTGELGLF